MWEVAGQLQTGFVTEEFTALSGVGVFVMECHPSHFPSQHHLTMPVALVEHFE